MARCMYCHHCGKCGPGSYEDNSIKPGECPFCHAENEPGALVCASCGNPLPLPPGAVAAPARPQAS